LCCISTPAASRPALTRRSCTPAYYQTDGRFVNGGNHTAPRSVNPIAHASRRDEFIDAGQELIISKGYEQLSIEDVLAAAGASKGAFYHYFDSKQALLEAIVNRMATTAVAVVGRVVSDPDLSAVAKLHSYFGAIGAFKSERKEFLLALMRVWYSDDNAIVREKLRRQQIRLVTPHLATIVRQGIAEGTFTLADPDEMARVVLSLILDTGDEAGQLWLARMAGEIEFDEVRLRFQTYETALERVLGVAPGSLQLVDDEMLHEWFDPPTNRRES
jgi:AcrR family transcriptional regulator